MIFIRMQAANDSGDLNDLRAFTTPEMFAAVKLDLQERGPRRSAPTSSASTPKCSTSPRKPTAGRQRPLPRPDPRGDGRRRRAVRRGLAPGQAHRRQPRVGDRRHPAGGRPPAGLKLFVVTGASRGMGAALAEQRPADAGHPVPLLCLSRRRRARSGAPRAAARPCEQWQADLAEPVAVAARLQAWLAARDGRPLRPGHADQQRRRADADRPARGLQRRGALGGPARRPRGAAGADRGVPARHRRAGAASGACSTSRPASAGGRWPDRRPTAPPRPAWTTCRVPSRSTRPCRQRRQDRLARAGRDRHRHAVAAAQAAAPRLPGSADLRRAEGNRAADLRQDAAARVLAFLGRADFGTAPVADVRDA